MHPALKYVGALTSSALWPRRSPSLQTPAGNKPAQDKYTVKVPGGIALSECRGYEKWEVISLSHPGDMFALISGNPAMIDAYKAGIPANGKPSRATRS